MTKLQHKSNIKITVFLSTIFTAILIFSFFVYSQFLLQRGPFTEQYSQFDNILKTSQVPTFTGTPPDITIQNETWYSIDWTASDDNPTTYNITHNSTLVDEGTWESDTPIKFDLYLDIGVYNFTIYVNDIDGYFISDSVIVNVTDLGLPILNIKTMQNGENREFFQCGDGLFTLQFFNSTPINTINVELIGYHQPYDLWIFEQNFGAPVVCEPYTLATFFPITHNLNYNNSLGYFQLTPASDDLYIWGLLLGGPGGFPAALYGINVNSIAYNILNLMTIVVNSGAEFVYNQTAFGGLWDDLTLERWNKDITPPTYQSPVVDVPDDPSTNFEVNINVTDEEFGSGVKEVTLYYSVKGGQWNEESMLLFNGTYTASIPRQSEGTKIRYKVEYVDNAGNDNTTTEYAITAPVFESPTILPPTIGVLIGIVGVISVAVFYRIRKKRTRRGVR